MDRKRALVLFGVGVGIVATVLVVRERRERERAETAGIRAVLDDAISVMAAAASENLKPLAPQEFLAAEAEIGRATGLLAARDLGPALGSAEQGLALATAARELALERVPVARAAQLHSITNKVLYRAADGVAWSDAQRGMNLFDRDRISTQERSEAMVRFDSTNQMRIEENSVLVLERMVENRAQSAVTMTFSVPQGGVRPVLTRDSNNKDIRLEINMPQAGIVVDTAGTSDGQVEVGARVYADNTNRVAVYRGTAEVVGRSGERQTVGPNQFTEVSSDGAVSAPAPLPTAAITLLPGRDATVYVSQQRPEVNFKWKANGTCASFRIELASDETFVDKVVDEVLKESRFRYAQLRPGRYFWRMSCRDAKGTEGASSEVTRFEVVRDDQAPRLAVLAPAENAVIDGDKVEARCSTEPLTAVFINGEEAVVGGENQYVRQVALSLGVNTVVFEAVDAAGNVMYHSRLVTRRR